MITRQKKIDFLLCGIQYSGNPFSKIMNCELTGIIFSNSPNKVKPLPLQERGAMYHKRYQPQSSSGFRGSSNCVYILYIELMQK